jgi:hypothetical protein
MADNANHKPWRTLQQQLGLRYASERHYLAASNLMKSRNVLGGVRVWEDIDKKGSCEVFTALTVKNAVFWGVTQCGSCKNRRFGGTYRLHHQGDRNWRVRKSVSCN